MTEIKLQSEYPDLDKYKDDKGDIIYCKKGLYVYHNPYGPAIIDKNGKTKFYIDGVLLGVKKLESEYPDLDKYNKYDSIYGNIICYYKKGTNIKHNPYGPAYIDGGDYLYYIEGKLHRIDGPASIGSNGTYQYYINDKLFARNKEQFYNNIKNLNTKTINKQNKIDVLNIKNCITNGFDNKSFNILKLLL